MRFEFLLDIAQYSLSKISSNHKRNIKKSTKAGAKIIFPADIDAMRSHIALVNANLGIKGVGGITNSSEYFRYLIEKNAGLLMQVTESGQPLASTFFITNQNYAYYHSSGTSDRGKQIGAAYFLVDCMITEMQKRQMRYLNLGGCTSKQTGLQRFKMGFRPEARILVSTSRRLVETARHRIRSFLSTKPEDILKVKRVKVYRKSVTGLSPVNIEDYTLKKLSFDALFETISTILELSPCLDIFCRAGPRCYALFNKQGQILAIGFVETAEVSQKSGVKKHSLPSDAAEITYLQVVSAMQAKGIARLLMSLLEREVFNIGCKKVYSRVAAQDVASQNMVLAAGFEIVGEEKVISTALMGGCSRIMGRLEV